ncbi:hypothetical protein ANCCEY_03947 [Ancylostoma ceylanicum]|uniref:SSD domain-containing protein n=1 Tax=Ancylostoma ceylanicum TaxID=53326 RepID=A0A0D6LYS5_9BILA|nr:hypothetical protein ANCCEY_03947 [Ancylostoma ceylanicum]
MSLFCLATSVALLIDYIVTYTILAPVVYLCSDKKEYQPALPTKPTGNDFLSRYSRLLCSLNGRLLCGVFLITVYSISAVGVYSMKSTFEPAKAFPSDSPLVKSLKRIRPIFNTYFPVNIYVNHPPNISDAEQHAGFYNMVNQLETVEGAYGRNRTMLFLDAYERFDKKVHLSIFMFSHRSIPIAYIRPSGHRHDEVVLPSSRPGIQAQSPQHAVLAGQSGKSTVNPICQG